MTKNILRVFALVALPVVSACDKPAYIKNPSDSFFSDVETRKIIEGIEKAAGVTLDEGQKQEIACPIQKISNQDAAILRSSGEIIEEALGKVDVPDDITRIVVGEVVDRIDNVLSLDELGYQGVLVKTVLDNMFVKAEECDFLSISDTIAESKGFQALNP